MIYSGMWGMYKPPSSLSLTCLLLLAQSLSQLWGPVSRNLKDSVQFGLLVSLSLS